MRFVFLGLSITSTWGNTHAGPYRLLVRELVHRGHDVLFLERDRPWYSSHRDMPRPKGVEIYESFETLVSRFAEQVRWADVVVLGSYVPDGARLASWVLATAQGVKVFYDFDTPATLAGLEAGTCEYLTRGTLPGFDLYLSSTGGRPLNVLEDRWGAACARPLFVTADPLACYPEEGRADRRWDMGYLGVGCAANQAALQALLLTPTREYPERRSVVAGEHYTGTSAWPSNVDRLTRLSSGEHRRFFHSSRFVLNLANATDTPNVHLFEAAACGSAIMCQNWDGLRTVFEPDEVFVVERAQDVLACWTLLDDDEVARRGARARRRFLTSHTPAQRALQLETYLAEVKASSSPSRSRPAFPAQAL